VQITHLSLANFRNYARVELALPSGPVLFVGENAQGKTNLLEAVYLLSTTRSLRAGSDIELIRREILDDLLVAARVSATAERAAGPVHVEVAIGRREPPGGGAGVLHAVKQLRVNGVPHRAAGVIGQILSVFFTSLDIDLITGPPAGRRRYLDITLSQVDHAYLRALQRYNRVIQQRNSLLRQIDEGRAGPEQLAPWDEELITQGAQIITTRAAAIRALAERAAAIQAGLSDGRERLAISYQPQLGGDAPALAEPIDAGELREQFRRALTRRHAREIAAGVSLIGPHRDELRFDLNGVPAAAFGSRAQQRTVALSLRLAEADFIKAASGESPVLLLDDILSELDDRRRRAVLETVASAEQALITTADLDRFGGAFLQGATIFAVSNGIVEALS
jgi:DNA replication and repair protein RecF